MCKNGLLVTLLAIECVHLKPTLIQHLSNHAELVGDGSLRVSEALNVATFAGMPECPSTAQISSKEVDEEERRIQKPVLPKDSPAFPHVLASFCEQEMAEDGHGHNKGDASVFSGESVLSQLDASGVVHRAVRINMLKPETLAGEVVVAPLDHFRVYIHSHVGTIGS
jgi:hypothetical protein